MAVLSGVFKTELEKLADLLSLSVEVLFELLLLLTYLQGNYIDKSALYLTKL